jgi:D-alanyl-D-alanine carboxypeptidase
MRSMLHNWYNCKRRGFWLALLTLLSLVALPVPASATTTAATLPDQIATFAEANHFSGAILVDQGGRIVARRAFGLADRAFAVPARPDTRFRIASITKLFAATLVLRLAERGRLDLDAPIRRYLSDYPGGGADRVTVHQLLNHTSGLAQFDRVASLEQALREGIEQYQRPQTPEDLLRRCCSGPLAREPGSAFDYNNSDYIVLGRIIERVTGKSFEQVLGEEILQPLGMSDTGFARQAAIIPRLAPSYYWRGESDGWMNDLPVYFENWDAAGAMYSTADDLLLFARALYGGRLIAASMLARMLTAGQDDYGYGLWSYQFTRAGRTYRVAKRPGRIMGANAVLYRLIDQDATVILLANTNRTDLDRFAQQIADWMVTAR